MTSEEYDKLRILLRKYLESYSMLNFFELVTHILQEIKGE